MRKPTLFIVSAFVSSIAWAVEGAAPSFFSMRCDDNHSPAQWRQVAEIFEAEGQRVSFAVNSSHLTDEQGMCLKELSLRGHEVMDHTAQHGFYTMAFGTSDDCARWAKAPFVSEVGANGKSLLCNAEIDWKHPRALKFRASIQKGEVIVADKAVRERLHFTAKFFVPSLKRWFGVCKVDGDRRFIKDFWGRALPNDFTVAETEMITLPQDAIQPSKELLRAQATLSRANFDRFGIRRPTFWIQPGGWEAFLSWQRLKGVMGDEFGYLGADAVVGGSSWRGVCADPDREHGRWTLLPDFAYFDEGASLDGVKARVADSLARHRSFAFISHMNGTRVGGWQNWLKSTRDFAHWIKDAKIPTKTHSQLVEAVYGEAPVAGANVFPSLSRDLDGNGRPDGISLGGGARADLLTGAITLARGQSFTVDGLCGLSRGRMLLTFKVEGKAGSAISAEIHQSRRFGGWFVNEAKTFSLDSSGKGAFRWPVEIKSETIGATIRFSASDDVRVHGVSFESAPATGVFAVRRFGAVGDGVTLDTAALQTAIDTASAFGGGEVLVEAGTYVSGSIFLKSNVDFHLAPGAVIRASTNPKDYNAANVCPQNEAWKSESSSGAHLVLCIEQENVTLRGPGTIDGFSRVFIAPKGSDKSYAQDKVPWRPSQMLFFCESNNIRIRDLELKDASYWSCFLHGCTRAFISGLYIHNLKAPYTHNGDGIDLDCCEYVSISDCLIDVTDDGITLRGNYRPLKTRRDCAHVTISNCRISSMCNGIRFGVGNGKVHDIDISNLDVFNSRIAFNFVSAWSKTSRGCDLYDIRIANATVNCYQKFLRMYHKYATSSKMRDIYIEGISGYAKDPSIIVGNADNPFERVHLRNINVSGGAIVEHVNDLDLTGGTFKRFTHDEIEALRKSGVRTTNGIWD